MSFTALVPIIGSIIEKVLPDKKAADEAKLKVMELSQQGEFKGEELRYQAITAEANSQDPFTSRARPSFMYVMYILFLSSIPMAILYSVDEVMFGKIIVGFQMWLNAIPSNMYDVFMWCFLGYAALRTSEKVVPQIKK